MDKLGCERVGGRGERGDIRFAHVCSLRFVRGGNPRYARVDTPLALLARCVSGQYAPLPVITVATVLSKMTTSMKKDWFLI